MKQLMINSGPANVLLIDAGKLSCPWKISVTDGGEKVFGSIDVSAPGRFWLPLNPPAPVGAVLQFTPGEPEIGKECDFKGIRCEYVHLPFSVGLG